MPEVAPVASVNPKKKKSRLKSAVTAPAETERPFVRDHLHGYQFSFLIFIPIF
jgi:hypothetical protein